MIYCDPPWDYKGQTQHNGENGRKTGGANVHYPTLKLEDLKALPVPDIRDEDGCVLFMWTSSPHLDQAIELGKSWGFEYATVAFVWHKGKTNPGYYTMSQCEMCLVFRYHKIPTPRGSRCERQWYEDDSDVLMKERGRHSAKPVEIRDRITAMFPTQKKVEIFARETTEGWDVWGDEVENGK